MKKRIKSIRKFRKKYKDDLEYLILVGLPSGILIMLLSAKLDFSNLF